MRNSKTQLMRWTLMAFIMSTGWSGAGETNEIKREMRLPTPTPESSVNSPNKLATKRLPRIILKLKPGVVEESLFPWHAKLKTRVQRGTKILGDMVIVEVLENGDPGKIAKAYESSGLLEFASVNQKLKLH
jgi:hypothetical protein